MTLRASHALKNVSNNQSNGMAQRNVRGDVETRELKSASGTSASVFSASALCEMCQSYLLLFVYQSQSLLNGALQTALETVCPSLPTRITRWLCCLFESGAEQHSQLSRELLVHHASANAPARHTSRSVCV